MKTYLVLSSLVNILSTLFLGVIVLTRGRKQKINQAFLLLAASVLIWSTGYYFWQQTAIPEQALFWSRVLMLGAVFITPSMLYFVSVFLRDRFNLKWLNIFSFVAAAFFAIFSFSPLFVAGIENTQYGLWPIAGPLYTPFLIIWVFQSLTVLFYLIKALLNEADYLRRAQLKYILVGSLVGFIGGYTNYPLWYGFNIPPLGNILISFYMGAIALAVLRYGLLNVKMIATEAIIGAILLISFAEISLAQGIAEVSLRSAVAVILLVFSVYLIKSVNAEVKSREQLQKLTKQLRETNSDLLLRNRYLSALQRLTSEITKTLDFKKVTQEIVDGLSSHLGFVGGFLILLDKDNETLKVTAMTNTKILEKAMNLLPNKYSNYQGNFKDDQTLVIQAMKTGRPQVGVNLSAFISPPVPERIVVSIQSILRIRSIVAVPIFSEEQVIGCLLVTSRKTKGEIKETEIQMVRALADEAGIVTRNLHLYDELGKANNKLMSANKELEKLDKAKTEFLSIASHQLRTPLTAIRGYMSMIISGDYGKYPEKLRKPLKDVLESSERLIVLVNDLLDVSRIASGRMDLNIQAVDLINISKQVIEELKPKAASKKVKIIEKMPVDTLYVKGDLEKIHEVIMNLIDNAIKYNAGGEVIVKIETENSKIRFTVSDNGIGISPEELPRLFQRFSRTKEAQLEETEGTGLGLYVAKNIIDALEGKIWAKSEGLGKGSSFIFELPIADKAIVEKTVKVGASKDYAN